MENTGQTGCLWQEKDTAKENNKIRIWGCLAALGTSQLAITEGTMCPRVYLKKTKNNNFRIM